MEIVTEKHVAQRTEWTKRKSSQPFTHKRNANTRSSRSTRLRRMGSRERLAFERNRLHAQPLSLRAIRPKLRYVSLFRSLSAERLMLAVLSHSAANSVGAQNWAHNLLRHALAFFCRFLLWFFFRLAKTKDTHVTVKLVCCTMTAAASALLVFEVGDAMTFFSKGKSVLALPSGAHTAERSIKTTSELLAYLVLFISLN